MTMIEQATIDNLVEQHESLRKQVLDLQTQLQEQRRRFNGVQNQLEEGLQEVDEDVAETVVDFLNAWTPWEFSLEREYEVRCTMVIRVQARNADAAEQAVLD